MSTETSYHYWKRNPEYRASKFDIVGGFPINTRLDDYTRRIGAYYGNGEYEIDLSDLDSIAVPPLPGIVVGSGSNNERSATTIDKKLLDLFDGIQYQPITRGGNSKQNGASPRRASLSSSAKAGFNPVMKLSDMTDEILYGCPKYGSGSSESDDEQLSSSLTTEVHVNTGDAAKYNSDESTDIMALISK